MGFEYGYRFARQAAADVTGIVDYLAGDLANPTAAASFKKSLMECLDTLRMFPERQPGAEWLCSADRDPGKTGWKLSPVLPDGCGNPDGLHPSGGAWKPGFGSCRKKSHIKRKFPLAFRALFCYTILAAWCGRLK